MTDSLLIRLLDKPVGPQLIAREGNGKATPIIEVNGDRASVTVSTPASDPVVPTGKARDVLRENGLDPEEWKVTGFRSSTWGTEGEEKIATRFTFARIEQAPAVNRPNIDELIDQIKDYTYPAEIGQGDYGLIVALGDMQFGKIDGDGAEGTLRRTIEGLNAARDLVEIYRERFPLSHVHIAWLGDHVEGFVSQGGANTFRTTLTMNEQIRLVRRVMLHALTTFYDAAPIVSMAAIPGNHGEPQRFMGKGVTRYDDNHDTEALIAVADAAALNADAFGHVGFFVPDTDEMTVVVDVAGTRVAHVHGHQFRAGKHFEWWSKQAFNPDSNLRDADLLLAGHLHHELIEGDGRRLFVQVPALEDESTWYRHSQGVGGNPGLLVAITRDGVTSPLELVR